MTRELPRRWRRWAAHHRVHATMLFAVAYVAFSAPDSDRLLVGGAMVLAGQLLRLWAAGHIRRNVTLACTGPYRIVRHPLYVGSLLMGTGLALAVENTYWWLLTFVGLYVAFYWPAMHVEELRLQSLFGAEYKENKV
ncbi:MAG: methyltransferase family protein, partial [Acidobacteriota bacterium]